MARPKKTPDEILVSEGLRIAPEISEELQKIADADARYKGSVTRQIFMRGWAAYKRDGLLVEPKEGDQGLKVLKKPVRTNGSSKPRQKRA